MQKHVNLVDLLKSFPTHIFLQILASIQQRTSLIKFDHLAEKSEKGSISNLSTKGAAAAAPSAPAPPMEWPVTSALPGQPACLTKLKALVKRLTRFLKRSSLTT